MASQYNSIGKCYSAVADAVDSTHGRFLSGNSAYQAANQFASHPGFKEHKVAASQLPQLPAGSVVVWGQTAASPHGHISISSGTGQEISDHVEPQRTNLRGYDNFRVFMPQDQHLQVMLI